MTVAEFEALAVAVVVFTQKGCPSCAFWLPTFRKAAKRYARCVPVHVLDVQEHETIADRLKITAVPTVMVVRAGKRASRSLGLATPRQIEDLFLRAARGLECPI